MDPGTKSWNREEWRLCALPGVVVVAESVEESVVVSIVPIESMGRNRGVRRRENIVRYESIEIG